MDKCTYVFIKVQRQLFCIAKNFQPPDAADVAAVIDAVVKDVDMPFGKRAFPVHINPAQDGSNIVDAVADRIRAEFLSRKGLGNFLTLRVNDN